MPTASTKIIASHIIAFDGEEHRLLRDGELVYQGGEIAFVGKDYPGSVDQIIDARGKIVSPGLINTHMHMRSSVLDRSFLESGGTEELGFDTLLDFIIPRARVMDSTMRSACAEYSFIEALRSGTTTCLEIGYDIDEFRRLVPKYGSRIYFAPMYWSASWHSADGHAVDYKWREDAGLPKLEAAVRMVEEHDGEYGGLLRMALAPGQADTSSAELLLETQNRASELGVPVTIHVAQSRYEVDNMAIRESMTPVGWLNDIGFLQENVILGHAFYLGSASDQGSAFEDMQLIAGAGASVSHAPWVFGRDGAMMDSFAKYQRAGINLSLGTDTCPQNMIHAMRYAAVFSRAVEGAPSATSATDVFNAATLGGAEALGREDLGRLCPGARADIVIFSGESMNMVPLRDPIDNIVFSAEAEDVDTVIVDGRTVLEDGKVLAAADNEQKLFREIQNIGEEVWAKIESVDRLGRTIDELSPLSLTEWK
jgi:5-methylthioadenosine/S-adenosylhomocysteine deaminase